MFTLNSKITIGKYVFTGAHSISIRKSLHSYVDIAVIELPANCKVKSKDGNISALQTTGDMFNEGDTVVINLGYNNEYMEEFSGFLKHKDLGMPLKVECEGYSYKLRRNIVKGSFKNISVKTLLEKALNGTGVSLICDADINLAYINAENKTVAQIIDAILLATDNNLTAYFVTPKTLWVGLVYTSYAYGRNNINLPQVNYRLGYNCPKENTLKSRSPDDDPVQIHYNNKDTKGKSYKGISDILKKIVRERRKVLNQITSDLTLKSLANEKALQINYTGFEGMFTSFLQPFILPGYTAQITDRQNKDKDGIYLIESVVVTFSTRGARRLIEIGPKVGFLNE